MKNTILILSLFSLIGGFAQAPAASASSAASAPKAKAKKHKKEKKKPAAEHAPLPAPVK